MSDAADSLEELQLEVRNLEVYYDGIQALHGVSFTVLKGEIVTLIGANGAGKTSILRAFRVIEDINKSGTTILLVEQNANMALRIASRAYVLETGAVILAGAGRQLLGDHRVREAYLGA